MAGGLDSPTIISSAQTIEIPKEGIDLSINLTNPWFVEKAQYPKRDRNFLTPLYSGEQAFAAIADSIKNAKKTVEILCWGFDPGMCLIRNGKSWERKNTYGEILKAAADRGVQVRVMIWYYLAGNRKQNNAIGISDSLMDGFRPEKHRSKNYQQYSREWYLDLEKRKDKNLQVSTRDIKNHDIINEDARTNSESASLSFPSDHQKTVLVDYEGDEPVGYVMGHNSLTSYWDSQAMLYDNPERESPTPWHDLSMMVEGECLIDLNHNFCEAWGADPGSKPLLDQRQNIIPKIPLSAKSSAQITRTRPDHTWTEYKKGLFGETRTTVQEKGIKDAYFMATNNVRRFILVTNQYFQYPAWCRHLKEAVQKAKSGGFKGTVHVFVVTCQPEDKGMMFRAFEAANQLGAGEQFPTAHKEFYDKAGNPTGKVGSGMNTVFKNINPGPQVTQKELEALGLKVHLCMLKSSNNAGASKDIYVHGKLMVVDDAFVTLGSANLNTRSMAVDSEINLSTDDIDIAHQWRSTLFDMYTGGAVPQHERNAKADKFFKDFGQHIKDNARYVLQRAPVVGHAVPFEDHRSATESIMLAQNEQGTTPSIA